MGNCNLTDEDDNHFIITQSYKKLFTIFKRLKIERNRIIHVIGAPGTGKSTNIHHAVNELDLNIYTVKLGIPRRFVGPNEVFDMIFKDLMDDLNLRSREEIYTRLGDFDLVLIADAFHDYHRQNSNVIGFSQWTDKMGFRAFTFYLLCIWEYLTHWNDFKNINLVFQSAWRIYIHGKKYDLFSELGSLSRLFVFILKRFFTVVEISYSKEETIKIVKNQIARADNDDILTYIKKYGCKPRLIFNILENESL